MTHFDPTKAFLRAPSDDQLGALARRSSGRYSMSQKRRKPTLAKPAQERGQASQLSALRGTDVVVLPEEIVRVVFTFELYEPVVIPAKRGADHHVLLLIKEIEQESAARIWLQVVEQGACPGDISISVRPVGPLREDADIVLGLPSPNRRLRGTDTPRCTAVEFDYDHR